MSLGNRGFLEIKVYGVYELVSDFVGYLFDFILLLEFVRLNSCIFN